jgi:hypothetical protein
MKKLRFLWLAIMLCAAHVSQAGYEYYAGIEVRAVNDFYAPLSPYGRWIELPRYGWCWYPAYVDQDWRPYSNGNWTWSDQGWYWISEEPWACATYHYGRWFWDSYYGWVWVPGLEWAPAWVSWREGDGYVGWAPLPPECDFGGRDVIYAEQVVIVPQTFVFVEQRHFCEHIRPSILVFNQTIVNKTVNITKIHRVNQTVVNEGPNVHTIARTNPGNVQSALRAVPRPRFIPREQRQTAPLPVQLPNSGDAGKLKTRRAAELSVPVAVKAGPPRQISIQPRFASAPTIPASDDPPPGKNSPHGQLELGKTKPDRQSRKLEVTSSRSAALSPY